MNNITWHMVLVVVTALVLTGCGEDTTTVKQPVVKATPVQTEKATPQPGKPGLDVSLLQPQQLIPDAQPARIDLSLRSSVPDGALEVTMALPEGMQLIQGDLQQRFTLPASELSIELTVYADRPGKHYIKLNTRHLETDEHRIFNAIVWAGDDLELLKKSAESPAKGEATGVRELPAQETVY